MKKIAIFAIAVIALLGCQPKEEVTAQEPQGSVVYMTKEITPEALISIYQALGVPAEGRVAVKISTGEAGNNNHLKAGLIGPLVQLVNGKIVECNTAYAGSRMNTEDHLKVIEEHGFNTIGGVDIMDADGEIRIPVRDTTYMRYNIVGQNLQKYDFMINLAHFKGHQMGGFGGVLKNASIGVASRNGNPTPVALKDMGILASTDPVALDQACIDLVLSQEQSADNDVASMKERIESRHGIHTVEHAEKIGLGSRKYTIISIDKYHRNPVGRASQIHHRHRPAHRRRCDSKHPYRRI